MSLSRSYLSLESGEAPDPEDLTRPRPRDGGLVVEVVVHSAVAVVHEGGEGGHGRRRRLFADAERGGEGGEESLFTEARQIRSTEGVISHSSLNHQGWGRCFRKSKDTQGTVLAFSS